MEKTRLTITEAAEAAGLSRSYFHTSIMKTGKISKKNDSTTGKPYVETSELARLFPEQVHAWMQTQNTQKTPPTEHNKTPEKNAEYSDTTSKNTEKTEAELLRELEELRGKLTVVEAEKKFMQEKIDWYKAQLPAPKKKRGLVKRLLAAALDE